MDGHHILIKKDSPTATRSRPPEVSRVSQASVAWLLTAFTRMFWLGLKLAMPVVAIFLVDVALGIVAKTVPQMNVFIVGLPLKSLSSRSC